jgi:hypothetical protein
MQSKRLNLIIWLRLCEYSLNNFINLNETLISKLINDEKKNLDKYKL